MKEYPGLGIRRPVAAALLFAAAILSVALPAKALFTGDGFLAVYTQIPATRQMLAELLLVFVLTEALALRIRDRRQMALAQLVLAAVFCWIHVVFLPMIVSALYLGLLILAGNCLRTGIRPVNSNTGIFRRNRREPEILTDFMLGSCFFILLFCGMSLIGFGKVSYLRTASLALGLFLYGKEGYRILAGRSGKSPERKSESMNRPLRAALAFLFTMVLLQAGRMAVTLDVDTLWYGVRSEYLVAGGGGIYDNPGLVGMAYVYPKGFEILTLPLCDLASHSYLQFFVLWLACLGLWGMYRLGRRLMKPSWCLGAVVLAASVPGIMNMAVAVKPDIITWLLQLMMLEYFFQFLQEKEREPLLLTACAYLLSLTMKPTACVFSTALFGMMFLYVLYLLLTRRVNFAAIWNEQNGKAQWETAQNGKAQRETWALLLAVGTLTAVWARTFLITGMPVMSVFTSIFSRLGFELKYPFAGSALPSQWAEESLLPMMARRLFGLLLAPAGEDMGHVVLAWGSSLMFFLPVAWAVLKFGGFLREKGGGDETGAAWHVLFWPFLAVNAVSLTMLYQVDGNYFMLLYSMVILTVCRGASWISERGVCRVFGVCLGLILVFNVTVTAQSNWAWSAGFTPIQWMNKGRVDHEAQQHERKILEGNAAIWDVLAADPDTRAISFGTHPWCLEFPCNVQCYKDITSPWGNADLVESAETFEEYMRYARTDYVYAEGGFLGEGSWEWSLGLLRQMIERGTLTDFLFEQGNMLARVAETPVEAEKARENLSRFDAEYRRFETAGEEK